MTAITYLCSCQVVMAEEATQAALHSHLTWFAATTQSAMRMMVPSISAESTYQPSSLLYDMHQRFQPLRRLCLDGAAGAGTCSFSGAPPMLNRLGLPVLQLNPLLLPLLAHFSRGWGGAPLALELHELPTSTSTVLSHCCRKRWCAGHSMQFN